MQYFGVLTAIWVAILDFSIFKPANPIDAYMYVHS